MFLIIKHCFAWLSENIFLNALFGAEGRHRQPRLPRAQPDKVRSPVQVRGCRLHYSQGINETTKQKYPPPPSLVNF